MSIKKLLKENILKHEENRKNFVTEINNVFEGTKIHNNDKLINEIVDNLLTSTPNKFVTKLYEGMEDDMMDALLDICVLTFSAENTKLGGSVATFSLPAGWTCPFANLCLKKVDRYRKMDPDKEGTYKISDKTGEKIPYKGDVQVTKGDEAEFDCYAANQEMQYDAIRANRWHNKDLIDEAAKEGGVKAMSDLIVRSIKHFFDTDGVKEGIRIHESGDFFSTKYLEAWMEAAKKFPKVYFYAYTKSVPFIKKYKDALDEIPNLSITLSKGGKRDRDLPNVDVKESHVFNTPEEVLEAGLVVDLDDDLAKQKGGKESNFALLVHGTQEKGEMSQNKMRNETFMAYWKYRKPLNRFFKMDENHFWTTKEANAGLSVIEKAKENPKKFKTSKSDLEFKAKLLRYVVKYNDKYDFSEELINIVPEKYR